MFWTSFQGHGFSKDHPKIFWELADNWSSESSCVVWMKGIFEGQKCFKIGKNKSKIGEAKLSLKPVFAVKKTWWRHKSLKRDFFCSMTQTKENSFYCLISICMILDWGQANRAEAHANNVFFLSCQELALMVALWSPCLKPPTKCYFPFVIAMERFVVLKASYEGLRNSGCWSFYTK